MALIKITTREGYSHCECCGSYDWEEASVQLNGREILDHRGDTHMGGGCWHEWDTAVKSILEAMGYSVQIERNHCGQH
jgi:hypothetical protein